MNEKTHFGKHDSIDVVKNLTVEQLRDVFTIMNEHDMQLIVNALRSLAGDNTVNLNDNSALPQLVRLLGSIEAPLIRILS